MMTQLIRSLRHRRGVVLGLALVAGTMVLVLTTTTGKRLMYEGWDRDGWQQPDHVIAALEISRGDVVADLGAGTGYFTFRLARAVGSAGTVYAVDVDKALLAYLDDRAPREGVSNVATVRAAPDNPGLPAGGVDLIFSCNTFHHLPDRVRYFSDAHRYLRPAGRVAIVELAESDWLHRIWGHGTPRETIIAEMVQAGYALDQEHDFLAAQHFLVFRTEVPSG